MSYTFNTKKKVKLSDVKTNMVLAKDVLTSSGIVILAKNTMLNNVNFTKLSSNNITHVMVWEKSIEDSAKPITSEVHTIEQQMKPVTEKKEFKEFNSSYNKNVDKTKESLVAIGNGDAVDKDKLYEMTNSIISKLNCKSDVFSYLGYLKDTDNHIYSHSMNVSLLCNLFSKWIGMSEQESKDITIAGLLHDIGKTKIDNSLLNKKGKLTNEEFEEIKKHTTYGYEIIAEQDFSEEIKNAVLMHHEKIDGSGYPLGLKEDEISKFPKIVAICDIYDAMTSDRAYREKICPFKVIRNFEQGSYSLLDTKYLLAFLQNIAYTYVGSWVKLTNGKNAEVVFINKNMMSRPIVKSENNFIDLSKNKELDIQGIL